MVAAKKGKGKVRSGARHGTSCTHVCFKCGSTEHWARDCPKLDDDGSSNPRTDAILEPTPMVLGPAMFLTIPVLRTVQIKWITQRVWISCVVLPFLLHKTMMSVRLMLHF